MRHEQSQRVCPGDVFDLILGPQTINTEKFWISPIEDASQVDFWILFILIQFQLRGVTADDLEKEEVSKMSQERLTRTCSMM